MLKCQWWLHGGPVCHVCIKVRIQFLGSQCLLPYFLKPHCTKHILLGSLDGTNHKLWATQSTSSSYRTKHSTVLCLPDKRRRASFWTSVLPKQKRGNKKCQIYSQSFFNATKDQQSFALILTHFSTKRFNLPSTRHHKTGVPCRSNLNPNTVRMHHLSHSGSARHTTAVPLKHSGCLKFKWPWTVWMASPIILTVIRRTHQVLWSRQPTNAPRNLNALYTHAEAY